MKQWKLIMVRTRKHKPFNFLFLTYRAALKGDLLAAKFLIGVALASLEKSRLPPPGLNRFLLRTLENPDRFTKIMKAKRKMKRGRPDIDDQSFFAITGLRTSTKSYFGQKPSERHALALAYLISLGHPLNEAGNSKMESATVIVSELTGRSYRALQADYAKHQARMRCYKTALQRGSLEYKRLTTLARLRSSRRKNNLSQ